MRIVFVYLQPNFWFYKFGYECIFSHSFSYVSSLWTFWSFCRLALVGFLLFSKDVVMLSRFSPTAIDFQGTQLLAFGFIGMHSAAASNFSYSSFGEGHLGVSWRVSNVCLTVTVYWLHMWEFACEDNSHCEVLLVCLLFLCRLWRIFAETIL